MNTILINPLDYNFSLPTESESANLIDALPREVTNSVTGDKMSVIHSAADGFDSVKIKYTLPPNAKGAPLHYHLNFVETFEVVGGKLEMLVGGTKSKRTVSPGEYVSIPRGILHSFSNPNSEPAEFCTEVAPAEEFEKFIRSMYGLANDGATNADGMPKNLLHLALILDYADLHFPFVPGVLQIAVRKTLTAFARFVGAEKALLKYHAPLKS